MDDLEERIIGISKVKTLLLGLICVGLAATGVWLLIQDTDTVRSWGKYNSPELVYGARVVIVGIFGLLTFFWFLKLADTSPGLIINQEGITDNSSGVSAGFIPWSDVVEVREHSIHGQKFISILVKDSDRYIGRANSFSRNVNKMNMKMTGTPINILSNSLSISYYELHKLIIDYFNKTRDKT